MGYQALEQFCRDVTTMLRPRLVPCLLIRDGGLVKTVRFGESRYVGDPLNAVRIFNEKEVDELMVLDIDATVRNREPNYDLIKKLAIQCRMPLCYGGGVKTIDHVHRIVGMGVEKVSLGVAAVENPGFVSEAASRVGSQSIVVVMDVKKSPWLRKYEIHIRNGTYKVDLEPVEFAKKCEAFGAGEIVVQSIDRDGTSDGYDLDLVAQVRRAISLPITALGGAGSHDDIISLVKRFGVIGAGAGSLFVFKGKYRAVLINYPSREEREMIFHQALPDFRPSGFQEVDPDYRTGR